MTILKPKILIAISAFTLLANFAFSQLTPQEAVLQMQKGINLGNTLEPPNESGWNNPKAEEYYFDLYKEAGFKLVRIPVRWDKHTSTTPPFKINETWMNRVEQIVDWGLERKLFVVINSHHDDWMKESSEYSKNIPRFDSIWTQIAERFKDKSDSLIFEVFNEPKGLTKAQNNDLHARTLANIRKTNPTRIVILQGHEWGGSNELLSMAIPDDDYIMGSFHSYDPFQFTHREQNDPVTYWGSSGDIAAIDTKFKQVKDWSDRNNIPVFLGEFGARKRCDYNSRMKHYRTYVVLAEKYGFAHCAWDDGGDFRIMERQQKEWDEVKDILLHTTAESPWPIVKVHQDSMVKVVWSNYVTDYDSIIVQRRTGTVRTYSTIATLKAGSNTFYDEKLPMDKYYSYRVLAHYNDSIDLYSHPQQLFFPKWEKKTRAPFLGFSHEIPGTIEAEDFDFGGEGLAYHDADESNVVGHMRPEEAVEIYKRPDGGFHIGNALDGEWFTYSVNVKKSGTYQVSFELAALYGGGKFLVSVDFVTTDTLFAPTCYSWVTTKSVTTELELTEGQHLLRFSVLSTPLFNIDKFVFTFVPPTVMLQHSNKPEKPFLAYQDHTGGLTIKLRNLEYNQQINVFSISGKLIATLKNPASVEELPAFLFPDGIYIIQSFGNSIRHTQKIVMN